MAVATIEVSLAEASHFKCLVRFLENVELLARETEDYRLLSLVDDCRENLAAGMAE